MLDLQILPSARPPHDLVGAGDAMAHRPGKEAEVNEPAPVINSTKIAITIAASPSAQVARAKDMTGSDARRLISRHQSLAE